MIRIRHLTYNYPNSNYPALQDISLTVQAGEFVLLTGPSGSGKSTLLRCLNGLVPHFSGGTISGSVNVNHLDVLATGPHVLSHHVGFVQQSPEAQAVLDRVEGEIAFGLENRAVPPGEMHARVAEVLALLGLESLRQRPLATLSGGERQRVAVATSLVLRPAVLVLDEPTSQLDPQAAEDLLAGLIHLQEMLPLTIVLAEHRLERVLPFVDRVVHMEDGRILIDAPARSAVLRLPHAPPIVRLAQELDWHPLPLSVAEAKTHFHGKNTQWDAGQETNNAAAASHFSAVAWQNSPGDDIGKSGHRERPQRLLEVSGVSFAYGNTAVLQDVSLTVEAGEAVALLGQNGAGKTTLLQCVVGLRQPAAGQILLNGRSTQGRSVADICREAAYLPQNPDDLLFADSVAEELTITLRNHHMPQDGAVIGELLAELGLTAVQHAYPRDLSVGQRQRVALGAVTITRPALILLDEPTRGLDYAAKERLLTLWRAWLAQGKGMLLVTHDVELAAQIARRVVILHKGQILASGPTAQILPQHTAFAPQIARLYPQTGWLNVEDAVAGLTQLT